MKTLAPKSRNRLGLYSFLDCVDNYVRSLRNETDAIVRDGNVWRNSERASYVGVSLIVDGTPGDLDIGLGFFDRNEVPLLVTGAHYRRTTGGASQLARAIYTLLTTFY